MDPNRFLPLSTRRVMRAWVDNERPPGLASGTLP
jgi:hypothetical protein